MQECLTTNYTTDNESNNQFLFGDISIADAMYFPAVSRFNSYLIEVPTIVRKYMDMMLGLPAYKQWLQGAIAEVEIVAGSEI